MSPLPEHFRTNSLFGLFFSPTFKPYENTNNENKNLFTKSKPMYRMSVFWQRWRVKDFKVFHSSIYVLSNFPSKAAEKPAHCWLGPTVPEMTSLPRATNWLSRQNLANWGACQVVCCWADHSISASAHPSLPLWQRATEASKRSTGRDHRSPLTSAAVNPAGQTFPWKKQAQTIPQIYKGLPVLVFQPINSSLVRAVF